MPSLRVRIAVPAGTLLAGLAALVFASHAGAVTGFGYHDPRSFQIHGASDIAATADGGVLLSTYSGRGPIRKLIRGKRPKVVAGGGKADVGTEPIPATAASLFGDDELSAIPGGGFLDAENVQRTIIEIKSGEARRLTPSLRKPGAIAAGPEGRFLVSTGGHGSNERIREVDAGGNPSTVAGNGEWGSAPDGAQAADSSLLYVLDVAYLPGGGVVFSEWAADYAAIREIKPDGTLETLAGGLRRGFAGDGGPAVDATLSEPREIAVDTSGGILIADGPRVRRIGTDGTIETVAGTGKARYNGDGIPAAEANVSPVALSAGPDGSFLIGDFGNGRIRKVSAGGTIRTIAGLPAPVVCPASVYDGIQGEPGNDARLSGTKRRDLIRGETGDDTVIARGGDDCIDGGLGNDFLAGGPGSDAVDAENGDDSVLGSTGEDVIDGQGGSDTLGGDGGDDTLDGGFGYDRLDGGDGDDRLVGNTGVDHLVGEGGDDYIDAQFNERESYGPPGDRIDCGPGHDTVKANTYDRIARDCEVVKGAAGRSR